MPFIVSLLLSASTSHSLSLEYYGIEGDILDDESVQQVLTFKFSEPIGHIDYKLDATISNLSYQSKFTSSCSAAPSAQGSMISCDFIGMTEEKNTLALSFITKDAIKETDGFKQFSANYGIPLPIGRSFVMVKLPKQTFLAKETTNESYFPSTGNTIIEGRRIKVYWERENLTEKDSLRFSVLYSPNMPFSISDIISMPDIILFVIIIIAAVIFIILGLYMRMRQNISTIADVLNSDEKKIVEILEKNEGKSLQKIIVKETGFSKAKVSRLVKSLHARNVVAIEPVSGRENRIILKLKGIEAKPLNDRPEAAEPQASKE